MKTAQLMTQEQFNLLTGQDKWIDIIATANPRCDTQGRVLGYLTSSYPENYSVSYEMKLAAHHMAKKRKSEILAGISPGELCFASMGMNVHETACIADGVNNHRIRCFFLNDRNEKYFVEFILGGDGESFWIDGATDCAKEEEYNRKCLEVAEWNKEHRHTGDWKKYPDQDCYNPFKAANRHYEMPFTWTNVLKTVNDIFGCSYTSARKIDYFVKYYDFTNRCR